MMKILKFGGTSVASAERINNVATIVHDSLEGEQAAIVVSAMGGVTDDLIAVSDHAAAGDDFGPLLEALRTRHHTAVAELVDGSAASELGCEVDSVIDELAQTLQGISLVGECTPRTRDAVLCCGERLSARFLAAALVRLGVEAEFCDARSLIVTDDAFGDAHVDFAATTSKVRARFADRDPVQIVTGFIAADRSGRTTTLGRGGSDYTAAILGAALAAECIEIWTDVDGVMSADPRLVPGAFSLPSLSYQELMELSHFGAKVVYPPTLHPAREHGIPIVIRNSFNPSFAGTRVVEQFRGNGHQVRGISSVNEVALLRLEGDGMVGIPGIAQRLFGVLARHDISVILISQASSEHSICFAIDPKFSAQAERCVNAEFELERGAGLVEELVAEAGLSIIAVVGETMCRIPGIAGRVFSILGKSGINVRAIAQGSSELNISFVVAKNDQAESVVAVHDAFFPETTKIEIVRERIPTAILGATGTVGQRMVSLLADHPWFAVNELVASERSAGKRYREAVRWLQSSPIPEAAGALEVIPLNGELQSPLVLSALDSGPAQAAERRFAESGHLVVSNASAHRMDADVPLLIPEVNADHLALVAEQPYNGGAIITNPNCSTIGMVLALAPLANVFGLEAVHVVTLQAISGAGFPGVASMEIMDNVVPLIRGEEEKLETETRKILGTYANGRVNEAALVVSAQCTRVPVLDGHTECVSVKLSRTATAKEIIGAWEGFQGEPQWLELPSAPPQPVIYDPSEASPQPRLHREAGAGMAVTVGRLRPCPLFDFKFVALSHNTIRGAAGGSLLAAEMAVQRRVVAAIAPPRAAH